ncbi:hypothetical protein V8C34DRAFT_72272 [Trichoderma compactum]
MDGNFRQSLVGINNSATPSSFPIPSLLLATAGLVHLMQRPLLYFRLIACCHSNVLQLIPSPLVGSGRLTLISAYLDDLRRAYPVVERNSVCNTRCVREIWELMMPECGRVSHQTPQHLCYCARAIPTHQVGPATDAHEDLWLTAWSLASLPIKTSLFQILTPAWPMSRSSFVASGACS